MTEKLYSLDEIEAARVKANPDKDDFIYWEAFTDELTRPQPEFREGQVVHADGPNYFGWYKVGKNDDERGILEQSRPLTPEEVGPGYVPVEDVRPLVEYILSRDAQKRGKYYNYSDARELIPDNLKELIDE